MLVLLKGGFKMIQDIKNLEDLERMKHYTHLSVSLLLNHREDLGTQIDGHYVMHHMQPRNGGDIYLFTSHPTYMYYAGKTKEKMFEEKEPQTDAQKVHNLARSRK